MAQFLSLSLLVAVGAIYPAGHFESVHKLTVGNFDETVKTEVDAGRTMIVRWIASAG